MFDLRVLSNRNDKVSSSKYIQWSATENFPWSIDGLLMLLKAFPLLYCIYVRVDTKHFHIPLFHSLLLRFPRHLWLSRRPDCPSQKASEMDMRIWYNLKAIAKVVASVLQESKASRRPCKTLRFLPSLFRLSVKDFVECSGLVTPQRRFHYAWIKTR